MAADQFVILPRIRNEKNLLMQASPDRVRTMITGYHWFTDWGRDTMISLEGLTLCTGRYDEAKTILETFGHIMCVTGFCPIISRKGGRLFTIPWDATLWYFHAIDRYLQTTNDAGLLEVYIRRCRPSSNITVTGPTTASGWIRTTVLLMLPQRAAS